MAVVGPDPAGSYPWRRAKNPGPREREPASANTRRGWSKSVDPARYNAPSQDRVASSAPLQRFARSMIRACAIQGRQACRAFVASWMTAGTRRTSTTRPASGNALSARRSQPGGRRASLPTVQDSSSLARGQPVTHELFPVKPAGAGSSKQCWRNSSAQRQSQGVIAVAPHHRQRSPPDVSSGITAAETPAPAVIRRVSGDHQRRLGRPTRQWSCRHQRARQTKPRRLSGSFHPGRRRSLAQRA
jgi:hypothetical protein